MEATVREAIIQPTQDANMIGSGLAHSLLRVDTDIDKVMRQREPEPFTEPVAAEPAKTEIDPSLVCRNQSNCSLSKRGLQSSQ